RVTSITHGEAAANVVLDAAGIRLVATITVEAVRELGLAEGSEVVAVVKASDGFLARTGWPLLREASPGLNLGSRSTLCIITAHFVDRLAGDHAHAPTRPTVRSHSADPPRHSRGGGGVW